MLASRSLVGSITRLGLLGILVGLAAGYLSHLFVVALELATGLLGTSPRHRVADLSAALQLLGVLLTGAVVVGVLQGAQAVGPVEAIEATHRQRGTIGLGAGLRGACANFVALACGASAGQYGPLVHFGATIGSVASRATRFTPNLAAIGVGCGVSAAIAAAFAAPIAGVIFAHEVLLRHYSIRAFAPITVAAVTGHFFGSALLDAAPLQMLNAAGTLPPASYLVLAVLGVLSAVCAKYFMHLVEACSALAQATRLPGWSRPACAALALWATALAIPDVLGTGLLPLRQALAGQTALSDLALLLAAKAALTALCIGFGFAGGILSPALLLGTLLGGLYGALIVLLAPSMSALAPVFAIGAMAAFASAVIGAPLATILIVFELTHNYEVTLAVMITVVFSNLVSYRLYGRSFFDLRLRERGIDFSQGVERVHLEGRTVTDYLDRSVLTLAPGLAVRDACAAMLTANAAEAHLVDTAGQLAGVVRLADLELAAARVPGDPVRLHGDDNYLVLAHSTSVWDAMQALENFHGECVPVSNQAGDYLGALFESAVIRAYLDTIDELRREENAVG